MSIYLKELLSLSVWPIVTFFIIIIMSDVKGLSTLFVICILVTSDQYLHYTDLLLFLPSSFIPKFFPHPQEHDHGYNWGIYLPPVSIGSIIMIKNLSDVKGFSTLFVICILVTSDQHLPYTGIILVLPSSPTFCLHHLPHPQEHEHSYNWGILLIPCVNTLLASPDYPIQRLPSSWWCHPLVFVPILRTRSTAIIEGFSSPPVSILCLQVLIIQ